MVTGVSILPVRMQGVTIRRQGNRLIGPIDLILSGQGISIMMGANGAGKSTLLRALHGLERISAGQIIWASDEARRHQAFVFQSTTLLRRTVLDNIAYPLRLDGMGRRAARKAAQQAARHAGLGEMTGRDAALLSGGERSRLAIARALIRQPQLLILDEPCASLDPRSTAEIETMLQAASNSGLRILMSTHMIGQARRLADHIIFMHGGGVTDDLAASDFFAGNHSAAASAYLKGELYP